jgi:hypothetical protein
MGVWSIGPDNWKPRDYVKMCAAALVVAIIFALIQLARA